MLAQHSGDASVESDSPVIQIKLSHGSSLHQIFVPAQATFGDLKKLLVEKTGIHPQGQRLLFRGKEMDDDECLHRVGVKDLSKIVLLEKPVIEEGRSEEFRMDEALSSNVIEECETEGFRMDEELSSKACEAVAIVRSEVDLLVDKVCDLEISIISGSKVEEKEFVVLTELLMRQLLKLDAIEADGEAKVQRKNEVRRVQNCVDTLDSLKTKNASPFVHCHNSTSVSTTWEDFESNNGSASAPPVVPSSLNTSEEWERFD